MEEISLILFFIFVWLLTLFLWGKVFDQGRSLDIEREIFPDGPECEDGENLAAICSPLYNKTIKS